MPLICPTCQMSSGVERDPPAWACYFAWGCFAYFWVASSLRRGRGRSVGVSGRCLPRHCEERSDEAIQLSLWGKLDCFASLAMTMGRRQLAPPLPRSPVAGVLREIAVGGLLANIVLLVVAMPLGGVEGNVRPAAGAPRALVVLWSAR